MVTQITPEQAATLKQLTDAMTAEFRAYQEAFSKPISPEYFRMKYLESYAALQAFRKLIGLET